MLITGTHFIPPCVHYNPFSQRSIECPEARQTVEKVCALLKADRNPYTRQSAAAAFLASPRLAANSDCAPNKVDTDFDDLSVSDWTDFDEEEFESLPVWADLCMQTMHILCIAVLRYTHRLAVHATVMLFRRNQHQFIICLVSKQLKDSGKHCCMGTIVPSAEWIVMQHSAHLKRWRQE